MPDAAALVPVITHLFEQELQVVVASADTDLFETGALDSISFIDLLLVLERDFGLRVSLDRVELGSFQSIERIAAFVAQGLAAKAPALSTERRHANAE